MTHSRTNTDVPSQRFARVRTKEIITKLIVIRKVPAVILTRDFTVEEFPVKIDHTAVKTLGFAIGTEAAVIRQPKKRKIIKTKNKRNPFFFKNPISLFSLSPITVLYQKLKESSK